MGKPETKIGKLCAGLEIERQTLDRLVDSDGTICRDGKKLLATKGKLPSFEPSCCEAAEG